MKNSLIAKAMYLILVCFSLFSFSQQAYKGFKKVNEKPFEFSDYSIVGFYKGTDNAGIISAYSNKIGTTKITEGKFEGFNKNVYSNGIILPNGEKIQLVNNEAVLTIQNGYIYTRLNYDNDDSEIKVYRLSGSELILLNTIKINSWENINFLSNGYIIVDDFYELSGKTIRIYSNDMKNIINSFEPLPNNFSEISFCNNKDFTFFILNPEDYPHMAKSQRFIVVSNKTGEIIDSKNIDVFPVLSKVSALKDYIMLQSYYGIIVLDIKGSIIWKKEMELHYHLIESDDNYLFTTSLDKLYCLNIKSGETVWEKYFNEFYKQNLIPIPKDQPTLVIRPIQFKLLDGDKLVVIMGQTHYDYTSDYISVGPIHKSELIILNSTDGELIYQDVFTNNIIYLTYILNLKNQIKLINNVNTVDYKISE